jgi:hypothetical protein
MKLVTNCYFEMTVEFHRTKCGLYNKRRHDHRCENLQLYISFRMLVYTRSEVARFGEQMNFRARRQGLDV